MTLAIIDGDVLCYHACYDIWEQRLKEIGRLTDTSVNVVLGEDGQRAPIEFSKEDEARYLNRAWNTFKYMLRTLLEKTYCDTYLMAVKGEDNFRNLLYPDYKLNRHVDSTKRNIFVPTLRLLAVAEDIAIPSTGCEADDLMRMWALQAKEANDPYVICTIDKDLRCIEGTHYSMSTHNFTTVSELEAKRHYYEQLLKGDPVDNIPGVPRIGKVTARNMVAHCTTDDEFQEIVVSAYIAAYGDDWFSYFLSNAKMIHLKRDASDFFKATEWAIVRELT